MNLIISDQGDEAVGIFSCSYTIETPMHCNDDKDEIEAFRALAIDLFRQFTSGRITAIFEWELKSMEAEYNAAFPMTDDAYEKSVTGVSDDHPGFE
jgi:hypothetical protein